MDARDLDRALLGVRAEDQEEAGVADRDEEAAVERDDLRRGAGEGDLGRAVVGDDWERDAA